MCGVEIEGGLGEKRGLGLGEENFRIWIGVNVVAIRRVKVMVAAPVTVCCSSSTFTLLRRLFYFVVLEILEKDFDFLNDNI